MPEDGPAAVGVGARIKRYRQEKQISISRLARESGISKGYIWSLENPPEPGQGQRPSGQTLYAIAKALGVAMADLLGERLTLERDTTVDPLLERFAKEEGLPQADVDMLASIQWRGSRPRSIERWKWIYQAIVASERIDQTADRVEETNEPNT